MPAPSRPQYPRMEVQRERDLIDAARKGDTAALYELSTFLCENARAEAWKYRKFCRSEDSLRSWEELASKARQRIMENLETQWLHGYQPEQARLWTYAKSCLKNTFSGIGDGLQVTHSESAIRWSSRVKAAVEVLAKRQVEVDAEGVREQLRATRIEKAIAAFRTVGTLKKRDPLLERAVAAMEADGAPVDEGNLRQRLGQMKVELPGTGTIKECLAMEQGMEVSLQAPADPDSDLAHVDRLHDGLRADKRTLPVVDASSPVSLQREELGELRDAVLFLWQEGARYPLGLPDRGLDILEKMVAAGVEGNPDREPEAGLAARYGVTEVNCRQIISRTTRALQKGVRTLLSVDRTETRRRADGMTGAFDRWRELPHRWPTGPFWTALDDILGTWMSQLDDPAG